MVLLDLSQRFRSRAPQAPVGDMVSALDWRPVTLDKASETLPVPGLMRLEAVRMGNTLLPLSEKRRYPTEPSLKNHETVDEPIILLSEGCTEGGAGAVLERSVLSNTGLWQAGTFYVAGDWSEVTQSVNEPAAATAGCTGFAGHTSVAKTAKAA